MGSESRSRWLIGVAGLVLLALVSVGAYDAGVAHGLAVSSRTIPAGGVPPMGWWWPRPWGFWFFPVWPLLFFVFVWVVLARGLFWHRRSWRGWGPGGVPPAFDEWHRRAHGQPPAHPQGNEGKA